MPAQAPSITPAAAAQLGAIGRQIRQHRKAMHISAANAAGSAGMSRVTLHRIEHGEPSVTMGAYLNAITALGLEFGLVAPVQEPAAPAQEGPSAADGLPALIHLDDYPQLRQLAWHIPGATDLTPEEAFGLYERNWRHRDRQAMEPRERALLQQLVTVLGKGHLLV